MQSEDDNDVISNFLVDDAGFEALSDAARRWVHSVAIVHRVFLSARADE